MIKKIVALTFFLVISTVAYTSDTNCDYENVQNSSPSCYPWYEGEFLDDAYHGVGTLYINPNLKFEGTFRYGLPYAGSYIETLWSCTATSYDLKLITHSGYNKELVKRVTLNRCNSDNDHPCIVLCTKKTNTNSYDFETANILTE